LTGLKHLTALHADGDGGGGEQAEGEAAEDEEPTKNVELKGSKDTEIVFSGKSKVAHLESKGAWGAQVIGTLTVRKDIPSGKHWLQVNGQQVRTRVIPFVRSGAGCPLKTTLKTLARLATLKMVIATSTLRP
jgi:hypothetical protein